VETPDKRCVRDLVPAEKTAAEAGESYSLVRASVVPTVDKGAPDTVTKDEDSKMPLVNSTHVMAQGMALTLAQTLKHVEHNLFEELFDLAVSY
jgi:hypothetical protein